MRRNTQTEIGSNLCARPLTKWAEESIKQALALFSYLIGLSDHWDFVNISRQDSRILNDMIMPLFARLDELKRRRELMDFYISREYARTDPHLRIGFKSINSEENVVEVMREFDNSISNVERSIEWDEVEDLKALATSTLSISDNRLGKTGKLAHIYHHYGNISRLNEVHAIEEGRRLFQNEEDKDHEHYDDILNNLQRAIVTFSELYAQWATARNEQT